MGGLLETANLVREDVVRSNTAFDAPGCSLSSVTTGICAPTERVELTSEADQDSAGLDRNVFAVVTTLRTRAMRPLGNEESVVRDALDMESEKAAGVALWGGTGDNADTVSLASTDVATVPAGASTNATVAALLEEFWGRATGVRYQDTIIHLGVARLLEMFAEIEASVLKNLQIRVATSPGYPADGIAVTGPITVRLGSDEAIKRVDETTNDVLTEASRLASIEFDPCFAVVVQAGEVQ